MATKIEAFRLSGRVEVDAKTAKRELHDVERDAKSTSKALGGLKGAVGGIGKIGGGLKSGIGDILGSLGDISQIVTAIPVVGGAIKGALSAATGPMIQLVQRGLEFDDIIENATIGFTSMLKSEKLAADFLGELKKFGATTPFQFRELVPMSQMLIGMKFQAKEVIPMLTAVGDGLSDLGRTDKLDTVVEALGKMKVAGKVTMEQMDRLSEAGIDGWGYLANAVHKTNREIMKLSENGRIDANAAIEIILGGMEKDHAGAMDKISKNTRLGALSNLEDNLDARAGAAVQTVHDGMTQAVNQVNQAFDKGLGDGFAKMLNGQGATVSKIFNDSLAGLLTTGDFSAKFKEAGAFIVKGAADAIVDNTPSFVRSLSDMAIGGYDAFAGLWGIHSPSVKAKELGEFIAEGLAIGLSNGQARVYAAMKKLLGDDPDFVPTLIRESAKRKINPDDVLNLLGIESSFRKSVGNGLGYFGLGQIGRQARGALGYDSSKEGDGDFQKLLQDKSASWQLENLFFPFFDVKNKENHGRLTTLDAMYAAWGSGHTESDPNAAHAFKGGLRAGMYRNNPAWDVDKDGAIRQYEFGLAARNALGAGDKFSITDIAKNLGFTVNAQPVSTSNPVPVSIVETAGGSGSSTKARFGHVDDMSEMARGGATQMQKMALEAQAMGKEFDQSSNTLKNVINESVTINSEAQLVTTTFDRLGTEIVPLATKSMESLASATAKVADGSKKIDDPAKRLIVKSDKEMRDLKITWDQVAEGFNQTLSGALTDTEGTFGEWTKRLLFGWVQMLQQMAAQAIAANLTKSLFGTTGANSGQGNGSSDAGGMLGQAVGFFSSLFGGKRASGGRIDAGRAYLVGERGPEIIAAGANGYVTPNHFLTSMGSGGQGGSGSGGNQRFVFVDDKRKATEAMRSSAGEEVTLYHIERNASGIAQMLKRAA